MQINKLDIHNLRLADFGHNFNKTRQTLSDVILQEGSGVAVIPTLAKKITSELAEVSLIGSSVAHITFTNSLSSALNSYNINDIRSVIHAPFSPSSSSKTSYISKST